MPVVFFELYVKLFFLIQFFLMAAAITSLRNARTKTKGKFEDESSREPVSFHLELILGNDFSLSHRQTSVGVLRMPFQRNKSQSMRPDQAENNAEPSKSAHRRWFKRSIFDPKASSNVAGTKFEFWVKKFCYKTPNSEVEGCAWQDKLLIVTEKRIFIVTQKEKAASKERRGSTASVTDESNSELEIVDSIPMEEILSVQVEDEKDGKWEESSTERVRNWFWEWAKQQKKKYYSVLFEQGEENGMGQDSEKEKRKNDIEKIQSKLRLKIEDSAQDCCDRILRITANPSGFNRGIPFFFLVKNKKPIRLVKTWTELEKDVLQKQGGLIKLANQLSTLATKRRTDHKRETRFLRFQQALQCVWDSMAFNLVVLGLIVSNFIFTVQQLENNDPGQQRYFENVDLAYTIIFTIGEQFCSDFQGPMNRLTRAVALSFEQAVLPLALLILDVQSSFLWFFDLAPLQVLQLIQSQFQTASL
jgi:hypothetical protein